MVVKIDPIKVIKEKEERLSMRAQEGEKGAVAQQGEQGIVSSNSTDSRKDLFMSLTNLEITQKSTIQNINEEKSSETSMEIDMEELAQEQSCLEEELTVLNEIQSHIDQMVKQAEAEIEGQQARLYENQMMRMVAPGIKSGAYPIFHSSDSLWHLILSQSVSRTTREVEMKPEIRQEVDMDLFAQWGLKEIYTQFIEQFYKTLSRDRKRRIENMDTIQVNIHKLIYFLHKKFDSEIFILSRISKEDVIELHYLLSKQLIDYFSLESLSRQKQDERLIQLIEGDNSQFFIKVYEYFFTSKINSFISIEKI
ncbi:MAG: hypothetical protein V9E94_04685 [Microthrixaceae bacterium]